MFETIETLPATIETLPAESSTESEVSPAKIKRNSVWVAHPEPTRTLIFRVTAVGGHWVRGDLYDYEPDAGITHRSKWTYYRKLFTNGFYVPASENHFGLMAEIDAKIGRVEAIKTEINKGLLDKYGLGGEDGLHVNAGVYLKFDDYSQLCWILDRCRDGDIPMYFRARGARLASEATEVIIYPWGPKGYEIFKSIEAIYGNKFVRCKRLDAIVDKLRIITLVGLGADFAKTINWNI